MIRRVLLCLLLLPCLTRADKFDSTGVDPLLAEALKQWNAPGLAVAVVKNDEVVYLRGFGIREVGKTDKVTPHTIFPFASVTKAFAATGLGILIDEGKADWDDRVRKHLPWFRLFDPLADEEVRLRDLLCHRTGLGRNDLLYYRAPWSLEESIRRLAYLEPASSFRSKYEYNNLAYITIGLAVAKTSGMTWQEFTQKRLLTPLGMKDTVFTDEAAKAVADHATPHRRDKDGNPFKIDWYPDTKQVRAAGSLKGSVSDLAAWIRLQLNEGTLDGKRIVSAGVIRETRTPQIVLPVNAALAKRTGATQHSYGLGWHISDYHGQLLVEHGGANDGFRARVVLLPRLKMGFALMTNVEDTAFLSATGNVLLDHLLGRKPSDWHTFYKARAKSGTEKKELPTAKKGTKPSRELSAYAGVYRDRAYGDVTVEVKEKEMTLRWSSFTMKMEHYQYDTFVLRSGKASQRSLEGELAVFLLDGEGNVARVKMLGRTFARLKK